MRIRKDYGFCALEALLASGILAALGVLAMQSIAQQLLVQKSLLCRQEAVLILSQYKSAFMATKLLPKGTSSVFSNGVPFQLIVGSDTMRPSLQKATFEMKWTIFNKEFSETINGLICK